MTADDLHCMVEEFVERTGLHPASLHLTCDQYMELMRDLHRRGLDCYRFQPDRQAPEQVMGIAVYISDTNSLGGQP